jgi:hypothetical protein
VRIEGLELTPREAAINVMPFAMGARYTEQMLVEDELPLIPLYHYVQIYLFDPHRVTGISSHPRPNQRLDLIDILGDGKGADRPIFIQTEDGLGNLDVTAFPLARRFEDVMEAIGSLYTEQHQFATVVIDSLDWLEPLVWQHTARQHNQPDIESFGYGKGYLAALAQGK